VLVNVSRQWLYYTLIRLALFAVALAMLLALRVNPFLATVVAAIVGLCLSYLFLHKRREALARSLHEIRTAVHQPVQPDEDNDIENAALDQLGADRLGQDDHPGEPDHHALSHDEPGDDKLGRDALDHDKHGSES
jgi:hypothetical protein